MDKDDLMKMLADSLGMKLPSGGKDGCVSGAVQSIIRFAEGCDKVDGLMSEDNFSELFQNLYECPKVGMPIRFTVKIVDEENLSMDIEYLLIDSEQVIVKEDVARTKATPKAFVSFVNSVCPLKFKDIENFTRLTEEIHETEKGTNVHDLSKYRQGSQE